MHPVAQTSREAGSLEAGPPAGPRAAIPSRTAGGALWLCGYSLVVLFVLLAVVFVPPSSGPVAVVTLPGAPAAALVVAAAGGEVLRTGAGERVALAVGPDGGFRARLHAAGAFLVTAPGLAALCALAAPAR